MLLKRIKSPYIRFALLAGAGIILTTLVFVGSVYVGLWGPLPSRDELSDFEYQRASEVYSADSVLIGKFYLFAGSFVAFISGESLTWSVFSHLPWYADLSSQMKNNVFWTWTGFSRIWGFFLAFEKRGQKWSIFGKYRRIRKFFFFWNFAWVYL